MPVRCTVLIAAPDLLPALKARTAKKGVEVLAFPDTDTLRALDVITKRRPSTVALERTFAATSRGAALIDRIKADATLAHAEIRVVAPDSDASEAPLLESTPQATPLAAHPPSAAPQATPPAAHPPSVAPQAATPATRPSSATPQATTPAAHPSSAAPRATTPAAHPSSAAPRATTPAARPSSATLDAAGTRRFERVTIAKDVQILVDGNQATLVDLSVDGAQIISSGVLKPNQRVRITLADDRGMWRVNAVVAWASFEIPARYRAGITFQDADSAVIDAFAVRHKV